MTDTERAKLYGRALRIAVKALTYYVDNDPANNMVACGAIVEIAHMIPPNELPHDE